MSTTESSNPCCCWNLKDGCITIGIWSLIWSIIQMGIFSWQTAVIKWMRDRMENRRIPGYQSYGLYENRLGGGDWSDYYITPEEKIYLALFVVQIVNLIAAFFLLFASVALIYGIHTSSKFLIWPWFPCVIASIICSITYCVLWWVGNVINYWVALTVIEFIAVLINVYCLLCIFMQYRRILNGYVQYTHDEDYKPKQIVYEYRTDGDRQEEISTFYKEDNYYSHKQGIDGYLNATYEHEPPPATKVTVYSGAAYNKEEMARQQYDAATTQPMHRHEGELVGEVQKYSDVQRQDTTGATVGEQLEQPTTEYKDIFTEEWLKNIMTKAATDNRKDGHLLGDSGHAHRGRPSSRRSKSVDAVEEKSKKDKRKLKSKESVTSKRSHRSRKSRDRDRGSSSSDDDDDDDDDDEGKSKADKKSRRSRSESGRRHKRRHRHHRHDDDDSEVKTNRSDGESEKTAGDKRCKKEKDRKSRDDESKRHKRPRDVKREDKERLAGKSAESAATGQRPDSTTTDRTTGTQTGGAQAQLGGVPNYPVTAGGISIPQHIVIPPQPNRTASRPQKYQISSEIVISYSDKSAMSSDAENRRAAGTPSRQSLHQPAPAVTAPSPQSSSMISTAAVGTQTAAGQRNGGSTGGDSKSHGSTAV